LSEKRITHGAAAAALYQVCSRQEAATEWNDDVEGTHALGLFNDAGDGLIVDGTPEEIIAYVDLMHTHVHRVLG